MRVLGIFLLLLCGCERAEPPPEVIRPVLAMQVREESALGGRTFPGRTRAEERVNLAFRVSGPLIERPIEVGDRVEAGDLLAQIDPRDFQVQVRNATSKLERAQANFAFAESDYARALRIQKEDPGAISERQVDEKREAENKFKAQVAALEAELDGEKDALDDTTLRAPFDGTVVAIYVDNFQFVRAQQEVVRLLDNRRVEMVVDIPETLISYVTEGEKAEVSLDPFPHKKWLAYVKEVGTEASATTRTFPVTLVMEQVGDVEVLAGMAGQARFLSASLAKNLGIEIPFSALFSPLEGAAVWVIDSETMTVASRSVTTGPLSQTGVMITEGLEVEEWIVTAGVNSLQEGQKVRFMPEEIEGFR